jgi:hypothetical protein
MLHMLCTQAAYVGVKGDVYQITSEREHSDVPSSELGISADLLNSVPADIASLSCLLEFLCSRIS